MALWRPRKDGGGEHDKRTWSLEHCGSCNLYSGIARTTSNTRTGFIMDDSHKEDLPMDTIDSSMMRTRT